MSIDAALLDPNSSGDCVQTIQDTQTRDKLPHCLSCSKAEIYHYWSSQFFTALYLSLTNTPHTTELDRFVKDVAECGPSDFTQAEMHALALHVYETLLPSVSLHEDPYTAQRDKDIAAAAAKRDLGV